ncbi:MAG TPA: NHL repeat-containing protein [Solirubrobacterales bacterium]|nr:NHL repeat-containing protein [Solirubrobacterales bacterium]
MRSHAKAATAGSTKRQAKGLGRFFRGAFATRGASPHSKGSSAPAAGFLAAALASLLLFALAAAPAFAAEPEFEFVKAFGPDGTNASGFTGGGSVAIDQTADVAYVLDTEAHALFKFDLEGNPVDFGGSGPNISGNELSGLSVDGFPSSRQVAVDSESHIIYLTAGEVSGEAKALQAFQANGEPSLFTAGPGAGTNEITGFPNLRGVAVDSSGNIYVSGTEERVTVYSPTGAVLLPFVGSADGIQRPLGPTNVAVDGNGVLYVRDSGHIARWSPSEYPITAATSYTISPQAVDPNNSLSIAVDPATNDVYVAEQSPAKIAVYDEDGALLSSFGGPGEEGQLDGLPVGIAVEAGGQERAFVSERPESGLRQVKVFKRIESEPSIDSTSVSDVSAESATLRARINPRKAATTYRFEYGLGDCEISACTSVPLGGAGIGDGHKLVGVAEEIVGLQAATTYHFRVIAQNSFETVEGPDRTFTTQVSGLGFELADDRAWEMVSPVTKFAGNIRIRSVAVLQAAANGEGVAYPSIGSLEGEPEGSRSPEESTNLARRGAGGWQSKDITPPHTKVTGVQARSELRLFSPNLAQALVEPYDSTLLSLKASERTIYLRENAEPATYTPLVTGKEGFANVPPGTVFAEDLGTGTPPLETLGANSALTHPVFLSRQAGLSPGAPPNSLYMWSDGQLQLINQLPLGEGGGTIEARLGSDRGSERHAVSEDGSRVFWSAGGLDGYSGAGISITGLYARDTKGEESVRLDVARPDASGAGEAHPAFHGASTDGSVVFFTDSQQLTADASPGDRDLYRCVVSFEEATAGCSSLTDISAPLAGSGESGRAQEMTPAISEDGTHVYFVARGELDTVPNGAGESATSGEPNLYLWQQGEGVRFIATLSEEDEGDWGKQGSGVVGYASWIAAAASPDGRYFSFMSERSLSGYDNRDAISGERVQEVYRYDALADQVECVSCNPSGASPASQQGSEKSTSTDPHSLWQGQRLAATLPEALQTIAAGGGSLYRPRAVFDSGRIFFNAFDSLVPADSNGQWDVYQYEPTGVGDCSSSSGGGSVSRSAGGCVSLISSGTAEKEAAFLDASATGDDAFFITPAQLSVTDEDQETDVYDARVDGVPAKLTPNPECLGEACQPAVNPPNDPTPASAGFKGQGNRKSSPRKRCAKGKRQVRRGGKTRCVAQKQHKRKAKAKRAANKSGRASR